MRIRFYVIYGLIVIVNSLYASQGEALLTEKNGLKSDTSHVVVRGVSESQLAQFQADPDFNYDPQDRPVITLWDKIQLWIFQKFFGLLASGPMRPLWQILPYVFVVAVIIFVVSRLLKTKISGLFYGRNERTRVEFREVDENLITKNLPEMIDEAVREKKYRWAVHLLYLNILKTLAEKDVIEWKADKTNSDYVSEVEAARIKPQFAEVTRLFERFWYGDFPLDESKFDKVFNQFKDLDRLILSE